MTQLRIAGLAAALGLAMTSLPAHADIVLSFAQSGASVAGVSLNGTVVVSDAAYAQGLNLSYGLTPAGVVSGDASGLLSLDFNVSIPGFTTQVTLADLAAGQGLPAGSIACGLLSGTGTQIRGIFEASLPNLYNFVMLIDPGTYFAGFRTAAGPCADVCTFSGQVTTTVPESGTLSLLAVGGAALLAARRRRAVA